MEDTGEWRAGVGGCRAGLARLLSLVFEPSGEKLRQRFRPALVVLLRALVLHAMLVRLLASELPVALQPQR
jgi:hypothetical protein